MSESAVAKGRGRGKKAAKPVESDKAEIEAEEGKFSCVEILLLLNDLL